MWTEIGSSTKAIVALCLYVPYRIVNYAYDHVMIFSKVVAHKPGEVSKLVWLISNRWRHWKLLKRNYIVNCEFDYVMIFSKVVAHEPKHWELFKTNWIVKYAFDHVWIGQIPYILGFIICDFNNITVKCHSQIWNILLFKNAVYFSWWRSNTRWVQLVVYNKRYIWKNIYYLIGVRKA